MLNKKSTRAKLLAPPASASLPRLPPSYASALTRKYFNKYSNQLLSSKRSQTSEAMTWIVATLIIIVLLGISIYAASLLSKSKIIDYKTEKSSQDIVMEESLFSYFSVKDSAVQDKIFKNLDKMNQEEKFYGDFNSKIQQIKFNLEKNEK